MRRKTLILFDVGAVLIKLDFKSFFEAAARTGTKTPEKIKEEYIASNLEQEGAEGQINKEGYYQRVRTLIQPKREISEDQIEQVVAMTWPAEIEEMITLKEKLYKQGYTVGIFSNIADFAYETIARKYPRVFETFDHKAPKIFSYQIRSMKPKRPMYEAVAKQGYKNVILIDDKDQYLQIGIEQFGWKGIQFTLYIDQSEPARLMHPDKGEQGARFIKANSLAEVKRALNEFGVEIK